MQKENYITIMLNRKNIMINLDKILYISVDDKYCHIFTANGNVYKPRIPISVLEKQLNDDFIKIHRCCIVSARAIHSITDKVNLINGKSLHYTIRKKKRIVEQFYLKKKRIIDKFYGDDIPVTRKDYHDYYKSFDRVPFAFTDIEMVFDEENHAIDWIFKYGNVALATLEKIPLERLIGNTFSSLFSNMDSKWLKAYECVTLYGEMIELIDYSPEIDTYLKIICFPTFKGHCGCILFNVSEIQFTRNSTDAEKALLFYFDGFQQNEDEKYNEENIE